MMQASKLAGFAGITMQPVGNRVRTSNSGETDFAATFRTYQRRTAETRQRTAENLPPVTPVPSNPVAGTVVVSPFNPLGLPISATLAPTSAEVEADPERWKGTSFDPALRIVPNPAG